VALRGPTLPELDPTALRKHFRRELDRGSIEATAKVGQSLFRMATEGGSVAAAIFWMKARAGWREKHEVHVSTRPAEELTDAELEDIIRRGQRRWIEGQAVKSEHLSKAGTVLHTTAF
jgi:hypothetical protein